MTLQPARFRAPLFLAAAIPALALGAGPACAQASHTGDNAVASAEDAFGTSVGRESIGVYDEGNVRGFSPSSAGNYRIEGLYVDLQGSPGNRVIEGETIHVGPAVQGYAFPAPTGIVDFAIHKAPVKAAPLSVSPVLSGDGFGSYGLEADGQVGLGGGLGLAFGAGLVRNRNAFAGGSLQFNTGLVPRWQPAPNVEIVGIWGHQRISGEQAQPLYIPTGNFLPPRPDQAHYAGPEWAQTTTTSDLFGLLAHADLGRWTLRAGLFRSQYRQSDGYANLILVNPDLSSERQVYGFPESGGRSWSGELRVSRAIDDGPRRHLITLAARGRAFDARYGGGDTADLGTARFDAPYEVPPPQIAYSGLTLDNTRQAALGLAWTMRWGTPFTLTAGVQRMHYDKRVATPGAPEAHGVTNLWLPSASAALRITPTLSLYGSWVRGLEDAGTAPGFAANAWQVLPAIRTRQVDVGIAWKPVKGTSLVIGGFDIAKPWIDRDIANVYRALGEEAHRGIEFSLTTSPTKHLRVVTGGVWQDPRVTADPAIAQPVGARPVNQPRLRTRFNVNWTLPFAEALTLDAYVNHDDASYGTVDNAVIAHGSTRFGAGARYRFTVAGKAFTARVELYNIGNAFQYVPVGSGVYATNTRRYLSAYLAADF